MLIVWVSVLLAYRKTLRRQWMEPVLRDPVLILESDDWGPGPPLHAERLEMLAEVLSAHRDRNGRHPVVTLGVVLSIPDSQTIRMHEARSYHRLDLDDERFAPMCAVMHRGCEKGVFTLQLHGLEHYWPASLIKLAATNDAIRDWLTGDEFPQTEALPPQLQSRWVDATVLPSVALPSDEVEAAAKEEVRAFARIFGISPNVVVPPTFVWTDAVERAWAQAGVGVLVTPGRRYTARDKNGRPVVENRTISNGERTEYGMLSVVRDDYFEPARGHTVTRTVEAIARKVALGRPALLETHRDNFTGSADVAQGSLDAIHRLINEAQRRWPNLQYMSTEELAEEYAKSRSRFFDWRLGRRVHVWLQRLVQNSRLRKLAWLTGLVLPAGLFLMVTRKAAQHAT